MEVLADRLELLSICKKVSRLVDAHSQIEALRGILVEAFVDRQMLQISATNLDVSLQMQMAADVRKNGSCVIDGKLTTQMLNLLGGDTVTLATGKKHIMALSSGECRYTYQALPAKSYPALKLPFPEDTVQVKGLPSLIASTSFATDHSKDAGILQCVNLVFSKDSVKAVTTDSYRIMSAKTENKDGGTVSMLIPAKSLNLLASLVADGNMLSVGNTGQMVTFMQDGFLFSAKQMVGEFADTERVYTSFQPQFKAWVDGEEFQNAIDGALPLAGANTTITLDFQGKQLSLHSETELGIASGGVELIPLRGTPAGTYHYGAKRLLQSVKAFGGSVQLELNNRGILLLTNDTTSCLLTPMRKPNTVAQPKAEKPPKTEKPKKPRAKKQKAA